MLSHFARFAGMKGRAVPGSRRRADALATPGQQPPSSPVLAAGKRPGRPRGRRDPAPLPLLRCPGGGRPAWLQAPCPVESRWVPRSARPAPSARLGGLPPPAHCPAEEGIDPAKQAAATPSPLPRLGRPMCLLRGLKQAERRREGADLGSCRLGWGKKRVDEDVTGARRALGEETMGTRCPGQGVHLPTSPQENPFPGALFQKRQREDDDDIIIIIVIMVVIIIIVIVMMIMPTTVVTTIIMMMTMMLHPASLTHEPAALPVPPDNALETIAPCPAQPGPCSGPGRAPARPQGF